MSSPPEMSSPAEMSSESGSSSAAEASLDAKESSQHRLDSLSLLLYTLLLTLTVLTVWLFKHRRIRFLHETGLAILYGLIIGLILRYGVPGDHLSTMRVRPASNADAAVINERGTPPDVLLLDMPHNRRSTPFKSQLLNRTLSYEFRGEVKDVDINEIDQKTTFDPEIFFNVILPPVIFHAGYSMKKRFFFRNLGSILTLAFVGTAVAAFVTGGVVYGFTRMFPHLHSFTLPDALHFGSLISATDPVTVLAIFNDLHVDVNLYALVFGESVLNDAVAIVMARTIEDYEKTSTGSEVQPTYLVLLRSCGEFLGIFLASFTVGSTMAAATAALTKFTHIRNFPELESTLFVLMSYSTFLLAEVLDLTGIVAVLFCGICQAHYTYNNLSEESRHITKNFFGLLNFMAENFIFCYIGVSMFTFPKHRFDPGFIFGSIVAIILGRALNVYSLCFLLNLGRSTKISLNMQHMMFISGLRGAVAFALAIRNTLSESRQMVLTTTLLIVLATVLLCGGSTVQLLSWLGIPLGVNDVDSDESRRGSTARYDSFGELGPFSVDEERLTAAAATRPTKSWMARIWSGFDTRYMKPLLTHSNPTLMETLPGCCLPLARILTSKEQLARHPAMRQNSASNVVDDTACGDMSDICEMPSDESSNGRFMSPEGAVSPVDRLKPKLTSSPTKEAASDRNKQFPPHI